MQLIDNDTEHIAVNFVEDIHLLHWYSNEDYPCLHVSTPAMAKAEYSLWIRQKATKVGELLGVSKERIEDQITEFLLNIKGCQNHN